MSRLLKIAVALFLHVTVLCVVNQAATLEQLSMDQMSRNATSIVRARVAGSYTSVTNSTIYTHYKLQVSEVWKGIPTPEVMLPGGVFNGTRQSFPGVPELAAGSEYVLFLWKSSSTGITHALGLTQGLFSVNQQADGSVVAWRPKIGEMMLDSAGRKVADQPMRMTVSDMKNRVRQPNTAAGLPQ